MSRIHTDLSIQDTGLFKIMVMPSITFQLCTTWWYYASCSPSDPTLVQHYAVLYLLSSAHCLIWPALSLPWGPCIHHQQRSDWQFVLMAHVPETPSNCTGYQAKGNLCLWYLSLWHYQNWASNMRTHISIVKHNTVETTLLMHWSYQSFFFK